MQSRFCFYPLFAIFAHPTITMTGMKKYLSVIFALLIAIAANAAIIGKWTGQLEVQGIRLPLVFHFQQPAAQDSLPQCVLDSPAQNAFGLSAEVAYCSSDSVAIQIPTIGMKFSGKITGDTITGIFRQGFQRLPLTLIHQEKPQPGKPTVKPYSESEVTILTPDSILLSGTLTLPDGASAAKPAPVAVLVSGSGPQNRDEELFGLKPFAILADSLARAGIATLRYDDRGTARSGGDFASATTATFAADAAAALDYAQKLETTATTGIIGHSEGGLIAFMLGATGKADFIVSLAGPGMPGIDVLTAQNVRSMQRAGISETEAKRLSTVIRAALSEAAKSGIMPDADSIASQNGITMPETLATELRKQKGSPVGKWMQEFLKTSPADYIGSISCPALALNGSLDTQVEAGTNIEAIRRANPLIQTHILQGLNHLFQKAATGDVTEYSILGDPFSDATIPAIISFIRSVVSTH